MMGKNPVDNSVQPAAPVPSTPGHFVQVDPPFSVTGRATIFGLEWSGAKDSQDNGEGFFKDPATNKSYNTQNKLLQGVSLPREVMLSTFGISDEWRTRGISVVWKEKAGDLQKYVEIYQPLITIDSNGRSVAGVPLVDAGPSAYTKNAIDLTYATAHALYTEGDAKATYMIVGKDGKPIEVKGWDSKLGKVG
jgi:hypothetical protein